MKQQLAMQVPSAPLPVTQGLEGLLTPLGSTKGKYADRAKATTRRQSFSKHRMRAGLLSFLAVVAITLNCLRICYGRRSRENLPRRLASREPRPEDDPVLSAILDMCLDMEEEAGGFLQTSITTPARQSEPASSLQSLPPYEQGQNEIPSIPSSSGWGAFQQHSAETLLLPHELSTMSGSCGQGWLHDAEEALASPMEGPSTSWQGPSMLPPYGGSLPTTESDGSIINLPQWHTSPLSPSQSMGLESSVRIAGSRVTHLPQAMERPNPVLFGVLPFNGQPSTQPSTGQMRLSPLQAGVKLDGHSQGAEQTPLRTSAFLEGEVALPVDPPFGRSDFGTHAGHVVASLPQIRSSASSGQDLANSAGSRGFSSSRPEQAAENKGAEQNIQRPSLHPVVRAGDGFVNHLFYRLPTLELGESDKVIQFSAEEVFSPAPSVYIPVVALQKLHELITKRSVSGGEANEIVRSSQRLASHLHSCHQSPVDRLTPGEAVQALGRRYVMMDMLMCAIQLLGPAMEAGQWWTKLANSIPSDASLSFADFPSRRCKYYIALANRLSSAIGLLKKGLRPSARETVSLKRDLFCRAQSHPEFRHPRWEPWRSDDRK